MKDGIEVEYSLSVDYYEEIPPFREQKIGTPLFVF
jgi:hypothetical protein